MYDFEEITFIISIESEKLEKNQKNDSQRIELIISERVGATST